MTKHSNYEKPGGIRLVRVYGEKAGCEELNDEELLIRWKMLGLPSIDVVTNAVEKKIILVPFVCPSHGEFIAWKKVNGKIIKLKIPEDAKRLTSIDRKCRCDKAFVLAIENIDGTDSGLTEITNEKYATCTYKVGEMVYPDSFDENRFEECSHGIHFFVDRVEAERW